MGQVYEVEMCARFKNNDPAPFCECIKNEVLKRDGVSATFKEPFESRNWDDPLECFKYITNEDVYEIGDIWSVGFSASYGWEALMIEIFEKAIETLDDGSWVSICPDMDDEYTTHIGKDDGKVISAYGHSEFPEFLWTKQI